MPCVGPESRDDAVIQPERDGRYLAAILGLTFETLKALISVPRLSRNLPFAGRRLGHASAQSCDLDFRCTLKVAPAGNSDEPSVAEGTGYV